MSVKRISIRTKLLTWLVLMTAAVSAVAFSSASNRKTIEEAANRLNQVIRPTIQITDSLALELNDIQSMYLTALHADDEEYLDKISDKAAHFQEKLDRLVRLDGDKHLITINKEFEDYAAKGREICLLFYVTSDIDAIGDDLDMFTSLGSKIAAQIKDYSQIKNTEFNSAIANIKTLTHRNSRMALFNLFLILYVTGLFAFAVTRVIIEPVKIIEASMLKLSKGDLKTRIMIKSDKDELESLAGSINAMIDNLQEVVKKAQAITQGDFTLKITPRSKDDELVKTIEAMSRQIQDRTLALTVSRDTLKEEIEEHKKTEADLKKTLEALQKTNADLVQTQGQLLQAETLASIGQLAAGVAHEINNPVGFIGSNLYSMEEYMKQYNKLYALYGELLARVDGQIPSAGGIVQELNRLHSETDFQFIRNDIENLLRESHDGIKRIRKIISDLRTFARETKDIPEMAVINDVIDNILNLVANEVKYKAELFKNYGPVHPIQCYPQRLSQVFINLLVNASHAIEKFGRIEIKTYSQGTDVFVEVIDNGKGIPEKDLPYIFNPFFTSKPVGQGTGLGLSISREIIQEHGGEIKVESTVGVGTKFIIRLPVEPSKA